MAGVGELPADGFDFPWVGEDLQSGFSDGYRPVGEYSDYTWNHLPELPKNKDAMLASFAARMAFSNF